MTQPDKAASKESSRVSLEMAKHQDKLVREALLGVGIEIHEHAELTLLVDISRRGRWIVHQGIAGRTFEFDGEPLLWVGDVEVKVISDGRSEKLVATQPYIRLNP